MSSSTTKVCFNSFCKEAADKWRRGWRRLTGEFAHLCDRCASAYEDGKFCETFHMNVAGWRCCESCRKQIHCGCIVSFHMFVLLDAGGIECLACARKSYILTPNPAWPPPSHFLPSVPERMKDLSLKTWNPIAGSGPVPWHLAPSLFSSSQIQSNTQLRMALETNVSVGTHRHHELSTASPEMKQEHSYERLVNETLRSCPFETILNENTESNMKEQPYPSVNDAKPFFPKMDVSSSLNMARASSSKIEADNVQLTRFLSETPAISTSKGKQLCNHRPMGSCREPQLCNGEAQGDSHGQNHWHFRYRPQITDAELRQISNHSNSVVIPLFEKMLSASDTGRIGRLILPKRCAEAFFPYIPQPEGMPLKVQDMNGKDWVFQFRFWSNNQSRMYVLEGITPCIQSMQLKAGDVVTFSRLEPDGKLVMGGRKVSVIQSSDQIDDVTIVGVDFSNPLEDRSGNDQMKEKVPEDKPIIPSKSSSFCAESKRRKIESLDLIELKLTWKEVQWLMRPSANIVPSIVVVEGYEFEEFEESGPVIGRPTIPGVDDVGVKIQWVLCEDCFKWRKVPADVLLPLRWICSDNVWDPDRSRCSSAEELTSELLEHMLSMANKDSSRKDESTQHGLNPIAAEQGLHALANLAIKGENERFPVSYENTTKHPRHKFGCSCIVCLQSPSEKHFKHDLSCECSACGCLKPRSMEKRERRQLGKEVGSSSQNLLEEEAQSLDSNILSRSDIMKGGNFDDPKESEISSRNLLEKEARNLDVNIVNHGEVGKGGNFDDPIAGKSLTLTLKGRIDLNIQPDREEELSPDMGSGGLMKGPLSGGKCESILFH